MGQKVLLKSRQCKRKRIMRMDMVSSIEKSARVQLLDKYRDGKSFKVDFYNPVNENLTTMYDMAFSKIL